MCGEIDENILINQELLERFSVMARMMGQTPEPRDDASPSGGPRGLDRAEGRAAYMEELFQQGLTRAIRDASTAAEDEAVDAIASQAIAFARLAGFLAGQLPPDADLFRAVIEAVTAGHAETAALERRYRDERDEAHGHSHDDHDHDHDHEHHGHRHDH